jgi:PKD repeat protein
MGEITGWEWDFGDTGTSALQNPTHTYQDAGDYTVSLTVTGPGGSDTETKVDYIHVTEPSLTVTPVAGAPGSYFAFTGENWPADVVEVTISVNGTDLAQTVETDGLGAMEFALHTADSMSPGRYFVTARTNPSAMTYFDLDPDAPLSPDPGLETTIEVPETIEPATRVYLPLVMKGYTPVGADRP